jgi:putative nucleotidyltransferase with HDIG domain
MNTPERQDSPEEHELPDLDRTMDALPEVRAGKELWQNEFHEFDVYRHTVKFVERLKEILAGENREPDPDLLAAGWLHDIGKPATAKPKEENGVPEERGPGKPYHKFTGHEIEGEKIVLAMDPSLFEKLGLDQKKIAALVYCHYLPLKGIKEMRAAENREGFRQGARFERRNPVDVPGRQAVTGKSGNIRHRPAGAVFNQGSAAFKRRDTGGTPAQRNL